MPAIERTSGRYVERRHQWRERKGHVLSRIGKEPGQFPCRLWMEKVFGGILVSEATSAIFTATFSVPTRGFAISHGINAYHESRIEGAVLRINPRSRAQVPNHCGGNEQQIPVLCMEFFHQIENFLPFYILNPKDVGNISTRMEIEMNAQNFRSVGAREKLNRFFDAIGIEAVNRKRDGISVLRGAQHVRDRFAERSLPPNEVVNFFGSVNRNLNGAIFGQSGKRQEPIAEHGVVSETGKQFDQQFSTQ